MKVKMMNSTKPTKKTTSETVDQMLERSQRLITDLDDRGLHDDADYLRYHQERREKRNEEAKRDQIETKVMLKFLNKMSS